MPAERLGPLFPAMRPQIPFDRFAVIAALDPSVVVELPQFAELRMFQLIALNMTSFFQLLKL